MQHVKSFHLGSSLSVKRNIIFIIIIKYLIDCVPDGCPYQKKAYIAQTIGAKALIVHFRVRSLIYV